MLFEKTVSPDLLRVLEQLKGLEELNNFRLVGGTALSLQLGHRQSIDLDFFSEKGFDKDILEIKLRELFRDKEDLSRSVNGFSCKLNGVKCDFYDWKTAYIKEPVDFNGIKMAALEDIAAFKLEAITSRTEIKDFWDIAEILDKFSMKEMLVFYKEKYPYQNMRIVMDSLPKVEKIMAEVKFKSFRDCTLADVKNKIRVSTSDYVRQQEVKREQEKRDREMRAEKLIKAKRDKPKGRGMGM